METASTGTTKKKRNLLSKDEDKCKDTKTKAYRAELKWKMILFFFNYYDCGDYSRTSYTVILGI